jgi:hypothetical protein
MSNNYYDNQNSAAPNVALAHTIAGEPVQGSRGITSGGAIQPAGMYSTAPYRPPKRRKADSPDKVLCSFEECKAFPMKGTGYCAGHSRSLGLIQNWSHHGGKKDSPYVDPG